VLQKEDAEWVKKCMEYKVEGSRPRGRPNRTWREVVQVRWMEFNVHFQHKYGYTRDGRSGWKVIITQ